VTGVQTCALPIWRHPRINALRRVLVKLVANLQPDATTVAPWERTFSHTMRHVPLHALYQYEPTSVMDDTINSLAELGLGSVNDLRCFHPQAVACAKDKNQPLFALYRTISAFD